MSHVIDFLQHVTVFGPVWVLLATLVGLPLANDIVQRAKGSPGSLIAKAQSLLQLIAGGVLSIPAVGAVIAKFPIVGDILYAFAPQQGKAALPKPLSKVMLDARAAKKTAAGEIKTPPAASPPAAPTVLMLFLAATAALSGCLPASALCKTPAPALAAKCALENNLIACGQSDIVPTLGVLADVILAEVAGTFTPALLEADLKSAGIQDAPCVASAIENYFTVSSPATAVKVHEALKSILIKKGYHGSVTIKLKNGAKIVVVIPAVAS